MTISHQRVVLIDEDVDKVHCSGSGVSGHPKVYYSLEDREEVVCKYCDALFTKKQSDKVKLWKG